MTDMMPKVQWLRHNYPLLDIEVDGGVGLNTINACAEVRHFTIKTHFIFLYSLFNMLLLCCAFIILR